MMVRQLTMRAPKPPLLSLAALPDSLPEKLPLSLPASWYASSGNCCGQQQHRNVQRMGLVLVCWG